jgi:hypothetical protein
MHRALGKMSRMDRFFDARDQGKGVEIAADGSTTLRGAKVVSVSGTTITVSETLGATTLTWTIITDGTTQLQSKNGSGIVITDIVAGDTITVKGAFQTGSTLSVKATMVRDITKVPSVVTTPVGSAQQTYEGVLTQIPGSAAPTSLVMTVGGVAQTVTISSTTVVLNNAWAPVALNTFVANDTVRVYGYIPSGVTTITGIVLRNVSR